MIPTHKHINHQGTHLHVTWDDSHMGVLLILSVEDGLRVRSIVLQEDEVWDLIGWLHAISGYEPPQPKEGNTDG